VPAGMTVDSLKDIAAKDNLPSSFAQPWALPQTAVYANQAPAQKEGTPAMGPANTADPVQINKAKAAAGATK
jgi:hypothetical protein